MIEEARYSYGFDFPQIAMNVRFEPGLAGWTAATLIDERPIGAAHTLGDEEEAATP